MDKHGARCKGVVFRLLVGRGCCVYSVLSSLQPQRSVLLLRYAEVFHHYLEKLVYSDVIWLLRLSGIYKVSRWRDLFVAKLLAQLAVQLVGVLADSPTLGLLCSSCLKTSSFSQQVFSSSSTESAS